MTEAQRKKRNARQRARYAGMTEEERKERNARELAGMTPERREAKNACQRVRYAEMTEEERKERNAYQRVWWANMSKERREQKNARQLLQKYARKYGITLEQYAKMLAAQHGRCAICGQLPANGKQLDLDHNHKTGKARGLLCNRHNIGLGMLDDDPAILRAAADYLEEYA